jgi:hypothetical protein
LVADLSDGAIELVGDSILDAAKHHSLFLERMAIADQERNPADSNHHGGCE